MSKISLTKRIVSLSFSSLSIIGCLPNIVSCANDIDNQYDVKINPAGNTKCSITINNFGDNQIDLQYSFDNRNWFNYPNQQEKDFSIDIEPAHKVYLRGYNPGGWSHSEKQYTTISITGEAEISGYIQSLLYADFRDDILYPSMCDYCFYRLFYEADIVNISTSFLSFFNELSVGCYKSMFEGDKKLISGPNLNANKLSQDCYCQMFKDCIRLTYPPNLPADELKMGCYSHMFYNCQSLQNTRQKILPAIKTLPALKLASFCYEMMFGNCITLIEPPIIKATKLADRSCHRMFYGCSLLEICDNAKGVKFFNCPDIGDTLLPTNGMFSKTNSSIASAESNKPYYYVRNLVD